MLSMVMVGTLISVILSGTGTEPMMQMSTEDTRITFAVRDNQLYIDSLQGPDNAWIDTPALVPFMNRVWIGKQETPITWAFNAAKKDPDQQVLRLVFISDSPKLQLCSVWRARPGRGPIEHSLTIENQTNGKITLAHQDSLTLSGIVSPAETALWWICRGGGNASEQGGTNIEPINARTNLNLVSKCDDGASPVPWLAVQRGGEGGLYIGWEFSGVGRIQATAKEDGKQLDVAVGNLPEFKTDIAAGETFLVPWAFVGCYSGDVDEGSYALHQWILNYLRPKLAADIPDPILAYNLYLDAGGPSAKEADVLRSAAFCLELGFEAFMPDAMWFPECGDWRWDPARFHNGVTPIEQFVHNNGMKLALWCAWTNGGISEHPDALSVRGTAGHPDWFNANFNADWKPGPFYGGQVCLACPEAKAWELKKTQWLVGNHKLDYLKHDCGPIVTTCNKTDHRHGYDVDTSYWAVVNYYDIQEQLRKAYPRVILENCSGGGHIKDFGIIQRTHYTVTTDTLSNLPDRQSIYDSTFAMPPMILQAYTYERNYKVPGDDPGNFLWRSAMMSAWQIDPTNTQIWTDDERESAKRSAYLYKTWVRPMLADVKVHHILPRPDGKHWDGMFYWSPSLKRGTVYIFRPDAKENQQTVKLKGLSLLKKYWVWCEDGSIKHGVFSGEQLMHKGLQITLPQKYSSDLIFMQDDELGKPEGLDVPEAFSLGEAAVTSDPFTVTVKLNWTQSKNAHSYRITIADNSAFEKPLVEKQVSGLSLSINTLPAEKTYYWKAEAIGWGGRTPQQGPSGTFTTPALQKLEGIVFVSDMEWAEATAGADNTVHRDTNYSEKEIHIAGKAYPKGVWTHAFNDTTPADLVLDIAGKGFGQFSATAGPEDSSGNGTVQFQVLVDGDLKAESPVLRSNTSYTFDIPVTGAKQVTLRVLNGGDGYVCDHAAWGFARFVLEGATDPLTDNGK
ncbi:MAG TPA: NPCBM/NEW2 domain-containing protein [Candidatus Hydrogenedentes bacterium]|nr:NPCBM/NEW2 domain-containing protein [Candidatus Hydrogenedentota bacterium]